jgi:hypothetical protein
MDRLTHKRDIEWGLGILEGKERSGKEWDETLSKEGEGEELEDLKSRDGILPVEVAGPENNTDTLGAKDNDKDRKWYDKEKDFSSRLGKHPEKISITFLGSKKSECGEGCERKRDAKESKGYALNVIGEGK